MALNTMNGMCGDKMRRGLMRRGLKPPATVETSRREVRYAVERQLMVARPFKAGKENPQAPSSRSDERSGHTIARNMAEVVEA